MSIITNLDDITLVDTPVTILKWTRDGHVPTVEQQPRAQLFKAENSAAYRRVTLVTRNVYGEPFCAVGRLVLAVVRPTHGRRPGAPGRPRRPARPTRRSPRGSTSGSRASRWSAGWSGSGWRTHNWT